MKQIALISLLVSLTACGGSGDEIIFDTRLGPKTSAQVEQLPSGLVGDSENANHSRQTKKGKGMESEDGSR